MPLIFIKLDSKVMVRGLISGEGTEYLGTSYLDSGYCLSAYPAKCKKKHEAEKIDNIYI